MVAIVALILKIIHPAINVVPLKSKLDKLEFNAKDATIEACKSGDIKKTKPTMHPANANEPNGGDYWWQAAFYKIRVDHYNSKYWKISDAELDCIDPGNRRQYRKVAIRIKCTWYLNFNPTAYNYLT